MRRMRRIEVRVRLGMRCRSSEVGDFDGNGLGELWCIATSK